MCYLFFNHLERARDTSARVEMLRYIFREQAHNANSHEIYSLAEFEESDHDDKPLGRTGNTFQNHIELSKLRGGKTDNYRISSGIQQCRVE